METETTPPEGEMEGNRQEGTPKRLVKTTITSGMQHDKTSLLDLNPSQHSVPFAPNKKPIFVSPSAEAHSVKKELKIAMVKPMKLTENPHYDVPQQAADQQTLHSEARVADSSNSREDTMTHDMEMRPNLRNRMAASLQVQEENRPQLFSFTLNKNNPYQLFDLPYTMQKAPTIQSLSLSQNEVKSEGELDKVKGLEPEDVRADKNPPCPTIPDKSSNISSYLELVSKSLCPDDWEFSQTIISGTEAHKKLPVCRGSIFGSENKNTPLLQFLKHYYWIYDHGDRQVLLCTYHDEASFSVTLPNNPKDQAPSREETYFREDRIMKKYRIPAVWFWFPKHTKRDIVNFFSKLPKTQHDFNSFLVDMCSQTEKMLCFSVSGLFKEVEGVYKDRICAFTWIFITTPVGNSSLRIVNDQLSVRDASPKESSSACSTPVSTPSSSSVATLSQEQQEMVQGFPTQSGMNQK